MWRALIILLSACVCLFTSGASWAGPPFATDDPEPTEYKHFEIYLYADATYNTDGSTGTRPGLEVNYGAAPNLQISVALPLAFDQGSGRGTLYGYGATELGAKYRFIQEDDDGWRPQVSFYPSIEIPIGDSDRPDGVGGGHIRYFFPLWTQKSFDGWTTFGGGGYWINPGRGDKDYWFAGWALLRQITPDFSLGVELFHQTKDSIQGKESTGANIGAIYDFDDRWHVLASVGTGVQNQRPTDNFDYYVAVEWSPSTE